MKQLKGCTIAILVLVLVCSLSFISFAHSGRTDSSGGHHDYKNKSGLGSYHYHHGYPAHLHPGGVCPYSSSSNSSNYSTPLDTIELDYTSTMEVGYWQEVGYNVMSYGDPYLNFYSSDESIISVSNNKLTALKPGTVTITAKSYNNSKQFTITVKSIEVEDIIVSDDFISLQVGSEKSVNTTIIPSNATDQSITWASNKEYVAIVNDGKILAVRDGTATITATSSNGITKEINVEVYTIVPETIEASSDNIKIEIINNDSIDVKILPENSNDKTYTVNVKDGSIIDTSMESDTIHITPINEGSTEISIKTWNGVEKIIPVKIYSIPIEEIKIDDSAVTYITDNYIDIKLSDMQLYYTLFPENCTYKEVTWNTSDESIITVSSDNTFNLVGTGEVTLTCLSLHNSMSSDISFIVIDKDKIVAMIVTGTGSGAILIIGIILFVRKKINKYAKGESSRTRKS